MSPHKRHKDSCCPSTDEFKTAFILIAGISAAAKILYDVDLVDMEVGWATFVLSSCELSYMIMQIIAANKILEQRTIGNCQPEGQSAPLIDANYSWSCLQKSFFVAAITSDRTLNILAMYSMLSNTKKSYASTILSSIFFALSFAASSITTYTLYGRTDNESNSTLASGRRVQL